jgi:hypothetical protein
LIEITEFLEAAFLKHDGECKHMKHASDVTLQKALLVNGTTNKLNFVNNHGRKVDVSHTPKLVAKMYKS